jgi:hypothetical protein
MSIHAWHSDSAAHAPCGEGIRRNLKRFAFLWLAIGKLAHEELRGWNRRSIARAFAPVC